MGYVLNIDCNLGKAGDVVELEDAAAQPLIDAGVVSVAEEASEEAPVQESAAVTRAIEALGKRIEDSLVKATEKVAVATSKGIVGVPAQVKAPVFKCAGEMFLRMAQAKGKNRSAQKQLDAYQDEVRVKSPAGANETTPSQGGYFLKPTWMDEIWDKVRDYPQLLDMTDRVSISGNTFNINEISETSLVDGSRHGGVRNYWVGEAGALTGSFPALAQTVCVLKTNVVLVPVTNQLLTDANIESFDKKIKELAGLELLWAENTAVISGAGTTQPLGVLNQAALKTVTKSSNDSAGMFGFRDLANMFKSMYGPSRNNAVWLVNSEAMGVLISMVFEPSSGSATTYPAFGALSYNAADPFPYRIFGRPVIECLNSSQLGNSGDILFVDLKQLVTPENPETFVDVSEHVGFTTLETYFRFYRRYDINSPWTGALTAANGTASYSPFVTLQTRGT